jgi:hypothetical protein
MKACPIKAENPRVKTNHDLLASHRSSDGSLDTFSIWFAGLVT